MVEMALATEKDVSASALTGFISFCERAESRRFADDLQFEAFALQHYQCFWRHFLTWSEVAYSGDPDPVCTDERCEHARFFPGLSLNLLEDLLPIRSPAEAARRAMALLAPGRAPIRLARGAGRKQAKAAHSGALP